MIWIDDNDQRPDDATGPIPTVGDTTPTSTATIGPSPADRATVGQGGERSTMATASGATGNLISDSARIAVASALSRLSGLIRIVVIASVLGSTVLGDLFVAINVLPLTLYDVFAGSAISSVLVPPLVRLLDRGDDYGARRLAANALGLIVVVMTAVAALGVLGRGLIGAALTSGVEDTLSADAGSVAALFLLLIVPQLVLYAAIGVFVSIQHAHGRFLLPSAAPILENVGLLLTVAAVWYRFGGGWEVDTVPTDLVLMLAAGSGLSVGLHALVQFVGAWRAADGLALGFDRRDPAVRGLVAPARDSFGWSSTIALRQFALVVAAGYAGAGGVQAFEIAMLAYFVPVALIGRPVASAALPDLSRGGGRRRLLRGYLRALRLSAWLAVPAGVGLILLSGPLAGLVAGGRFDNPDSIRMLSFGLAGLGLGAAGEALFEVTRQATMAHGDASGLRRATVLRSVVALVGIPAVVVTLDGPLILLGLGLVVSFGDILALVVAHGRLRSDPEWPMPYIVHWPRIVIAASLGIVPAALVGTTLRAQGELRFAALLAAVIIGYGLAAFVVSERGLMLRALSGDLRSER